jgi:hypothetical protein|tara:strand:+ start:88 stop:990 length:903 start_codon:yes stop_codon:yes gene_type:complete
MKKYNGCVNMLSSRTKCLPLSLRSFWEMYNQKHNYPVYVHYFDDIYDDENLRREIREYSKCDITFISIPYETPKWIPDNQLFYNKRHLWYVNTGRFGRHRKGYLHMCNFYNNIYKYPNTELHKYDYILQFDDESQWLKDVPYDFFQILDERQELAGAMKVTHAKNKRPHQGNFDCRDGMWAHVKNYISKNNITPGSQFMRDLLEDPNSEVNFHEKSAGDSYVFNTKLFETPEWKQWNTALNESGGCYTARWGDDEMNYLFFLIHHEYPVYDFKTVEDGYHNQGGYRSIQDLAPSIKDFNR